MPRSTRLSLPDPAEVIDVVCAVEGEAYVHHCAAMVHSLLTAHPATPIHIDYLHGGDTSRRGRRRLSSMVGRLGGEISFHHVDDRWVAGLPVRGFTRKATWYRISLDELLPDKERVLYLDADLLVLDSLLPLWRTPLGARPIGAVTNVPPGPERAYTDRPELGGDLYFNAGVLLMDLGRMRRERVGPRLRAFSVDNARRLRWRDQDALNEVLHDRRMPLHPKWNCTNALMHFHHASEYFSSADLEQARAAPSIRHFEGPMWNKPWHLLADPGIRRLYVQHRRQTPWPRPRPTGVTPVNLARYVRRLAE